MSLKVKRLSRIFCACCLYSHVTSILRYIFSLNKYQGVRENERNMSARTTLTCTIHSICALLTVIRLRFWCVYRASVAAGGCKISVLLFICAIKISFTVAHNRAQSRIYSASTRMDQLFVLKGKCLAVSVLMLASHKKRQTLNAYLFLFYLNVIVRT